jgi:aerobic carbon-monoxide dehydrogenase large subunit
VSRGLTVTSSGAQATPPGLGRALRFVVELGQRAGMEHTSEHETQGSILGTRVQRIEDPRFITGQGSYIAGLRLDGALHVTYVRSTVAHARIVDVDVTDAARAPGVVAVLTAADVDLPPATPVVPFANAAMTRPFLADGVVRFVGEPIVAIVAESAVQGVDAADLVVVDYDPLPVVVDTADAERDDVLLFPEAGTNLAADFPVLPARPDAEGSADDLFADCEIVVEARMVNNRMAVAPIELRACVAVWDGERLTQWSCSQGAHNARNGIAARLGLAPEQVRVITPDVGGSFGGKQGTYAEEILVGWLARRLGRPVRWTESRSEHMQSFVHGRGQVQHAKLGGTRDGRLVAYQLDAVQDCGAYPSSFGPLMPMFTRLMASGCYDIPKVAASGRAILTNNTPMGAFRGAGRPEAAAAIERMVDLFAAEAGLDPAEVRRRNLLAPEAFPYTTATGASYDCGAYGDALDRVLAAADYVGLRSEQQRRRAAGATKLLGIGMASYVEVTNPMAGGEYGAVTVNPDGSATIRTGVSPHGQGHATAFAMIVSDATGIPISSIDLVFGDTDAVPRGGGTGGSRSLQAGGPAVGMATAQLIELARQRAAEVLEANPDDVILDRAVVGGAFHVVGTPTVTVSWAELAAATGDGGAGGAATSGGAEPLAAEADFKPDGATFPFGAHLAVVEVDRETGEVELVRLVAVDDAGRILSPLLLEGQIHGGLASGVAQALYEEIRFDVDGNPLTSNFADYSIISAAELPSFELVEMETPTPRNPLGAKGVGESGSIGSTPAVQNAVVDALAHLGIRHLDLPLTPQRVWTALAALTAPSAG